MNRLYHDQVALDGVRIHYVEQGSGPLVVLLHGFPDFWYSWRFQLPVLAAAGYRVVAPDLRGYNATSKPAGVGSYAVRRVAADVASLVPALGSRRAVIVGHDWGGVVGWYLGARRPELVHRLVILNAPHPRALRRELVTSLQALRSWYVAYFQLPWLPEALLHARDRALLIRTLRRETLRADAFTDGDAAAYRAAFADPATLRAAINYYRALLRPARRTARGETGGQHRHSGPRSRSAHVRGMVAAPTLLLWGDRDPHLSRGLTHGLARWVPNLAVERFGDAGHWVHWDAPDAVNARILEFLGRAPRTGRASGVVTP